MSSQTPAPSRSHQLTTEELAGDIARQREQLATTVNVLQDKVHARAEHAKSTARQLALGAGAAAGAAVLAAVVVIVVRRRTS